MQDNNNLIPNLNEETDGSLGLEEVGNDGMLLESQPEELPKLSPKPGYQTSQGQLTALFGLIAAILSLTGLWKTATAEKIDNAYQMANNLIQIIGPILALIPVLTTYINSRGKEGSNALWASASIITGVKKDGQPLNGIRGIVTDWGKIGNAVKTGIGIGGALGVPGLGKANKIVTELGLGDELSSDSERLISDEEIIANFKTLGNNDATLNRKLDEILKRLK